MALPFLVPLAIFGHWRWLAFLPTLAALALIASAVGLALAVALFALIGPKRTRAVAQLLAAVIGAAFFLVSQSHTIFGARSTTVFMQVAAHGERSAPEAAAAGRLAAPGRARPAAPAGLAARRRRGALPGRHRLALAALRGRLRRGARGR